MNGRLGVQSELHEAVGRRAAVNPGGIAEAVHDPGSGYDRWQRQGASSLSRNAHRPAGRPSGREAWDAPEAATSRVAGASLRKRGRIQRSPAARCGRCGGHRVLLGLRHGRTLRAARRPAIGRPRDCDAQAPRRSLAVLPRCDRAAAGLGSSHDARRPRDPLRRRLRRLTVIARGDPGGGPSGQARRAGHRRSRLRAALGPRRMAAA